MYRASFNHCAGCGLNGRAVRGQNTRPIPSPCYVALPFRSEVNFRLCQACIQVHRKQAQQDQPQTILRQRVLQHSKQLQDLLDTPENTSSLILQGKNADNKTTSTQCNQLLDSLVDVAVNQQQQQQHSYYSSDPLEDISYEGDVYKLILPAQLALIKQLEGEYRKTVHELQTSLAPDPSLLPSNTSSTNAEIREKAVLQILVYFIHLIPEPYRLNIFTDCLIDIGSGNGHLLMLAYAGMGIEHVVGIELVPERCIQSIADLSRIMKQYHLDYTMGYRSHWMVNKDFCSKLALATTRRQEKAKRGRNLNKNSNVNINNSNTNNNSKLKNDIAYTSTSESNVHIDDVPNYLVADETNENIEIVGSPNQSMNHDSSKFMNNTPKTTVLHPFSCAGSELNLLLPPGLHIFDGDINDFADQPMSEACKRFHAATHLCSFDLRFSPESLIRFAGALSKPEKATRWKVLMSMQDPQAWFSDFGLLGWKSIGKMRNMQFKNGVQRATVYFFIHLAENLSVKETESSFKPSSSSLNKLVDVAPIVQRQLDFLRSSNNSNNNNINNTATSSRCNSKKRVSNENLASAESVSFPLLEALHLQPLRTLCCGMAFITAVESKNCEISLAQSTTSAPVRDRLRLMQLETMRDKNGLQKFSVCSFNWGQEESQCETNKHVQATFGARGATLLQSKLQEKQGWDSLDCVFLDYFRFPGAYMRDRYGSFLNEMISSMLQLGLITNSTWLYLPNLDNLLDNFYVQYQDNLTWIPIPAEQYPLFVATSQLETNHSNLLVYSNQGETKQLDANCPFIAAQFHSLPRKKPRH